jgi:hypothetical protein
MTDEKMLSELRSMHHWTRVEKWKELADHFEEVLERVKILEQKVDIYSLADQLAE